MNTRDSLKNLVHSHVNGRDANELDRENLVQAIADYIDERIEEALSRFDLKRRED